MKMQEPERVPSWAVYRTEELAEYRKGQWTPARPLSYGGIGLFKRIRLAWGVFTGRYDALDWEDQPHD